MTDAWSETRTVIEHRYVVPCPKPFGGGWSDFDVALHWAREKAAELGYDLSASDWCALHVEEEQLVIVVTEQKVGRSQSET